MGTSFIDDGEIEPRRGQILIFQVDGVESERHLKLVGAHKIDGGVLAFEQLRTMLVAGINSRVFVFDVKKLDRSASASGADDSGDYSYGLEQISGLHGQIMSMMLSARGDMLLVGDIMKSCFVCHWDETQNRLVESARLPTLNFMTAVAIMDDQTYIAADNFSHMFTVARHAGASTEEERARLDVVGEYSVGEMVNVIRPGSLVMQPVSHEHGVGDASAAGEAKTAPIAGSSSSSAALPGISSSGSSSSAPAADASKLVNVPQMVQSRMLWGTTMGSIGVIAPIPKALYPFLKRIEKAMADTIPTAGSFAHAEHRAWQSDQRVAEAHRLYIDGDLVENFLELNRYVCQPTHCAECTDLRRHGTE